VIEINLRQEKMDEMREDMLIEIKLRNDDDYFYATIEDKYSEVLQQFANECKLYDRDADEWFQLFTEK